MTTPLEAFFVSFGFARFYSINTWISAFFSLLFFELFWSTVFLVKLDDDHHLKKNFASTFCCLKIERFDTLDARSDPTTRSKFRVFAVRFARSPSKTVRWKSSLLDVSVRVAFGNNTDNDQSDSELRQTPPAELDSTNSRPKKSKKKRTDRSKSKEVYYRAFFTINNKTVEVELSNNILSWRNLKNDGSSFRLHPTEQNQRGIFASGVPGDNEREKSESVDLNEVYSITPIYLTGNLTVTAIQNLNGSSTLTSNSLLRSVNQPDNSPMQGFQLHSYQKMLNNVLQEILIIFRSNSTESIEEWFNILSKQIFESNEENPIALTSFQFDVDRKILICFVEARPQRNIQVICNPYAGPRRTRNIYRMKIEPMLERARYKINYSGLTKENSLVGKTSLIGFVIQRFTTTSRPKKSFLVSRVISIKSTGNSRRK